MISHRSRVGCSNSSLHCPELHSGMSKAYNSLLCRLYFLVLPISSGAQLGHKCWSLSHWGFWGWQQTPSSGCPTWGWSVLSLHPIGSLTYSNLLQSEHEVLHCTLILKIFHRSWEGWSNTSLQGHRSRGGVTKTFMDIPKKDMGEETAGEIARCIEDWDDWVWRWDVHLWTTCWWDYTLERFIRRWAGPLLGILGPT